MSLSKIFAYFDCMNMHIHNIVTVSIPNQIKVHETTLSSMVDSVMLKINLVLKLGKGVSVLVLQLYPILPYL